MLQTNNLINKTIVIINSKFFETVIHINNIDDEGYLDCIAVNVSEDEWGFCEIDEGFVSRWSSDIDIADSKYKEWTIQSIFDGERNDWILDKES